jgi:hypothetical protein
MSIELITMLVGIVSILLSFAGAFGWMMHRMDARFASSEARLGNHLDKLAERIDRVAGELVEVKVAVARVEGPSRHLITGR